MMARRVNDVQVSKNFKLYEFECNDGNHEVKLDPEGLEKLQALRERLGRPISINSAYRTPEYNARIGGSPKSQHKEGKAFDIVVSGMKPEQVIHLAKVVGFRGIGLYDTFLHIDVRENPASWDLRKHK
jgi:uncharacterized protein YcbK (DUF882 family)